jgi:hypothetical protein
VLFSVVVLLPLSGAALLVVVVVVESVDFCVTSGDAAAAGDASGAGVVCVVVVVVVSSVVPLHPTTIVPAMTVNPAAVANNIILFEIFIGRTYHIQRFLYGGQLRVGDRSRKGYRH